MASRLPRRIEASALLWSPVVSVLVDWRLIQNPFHTFYLPFGASQSFLTGLRQPLKTQIMKIPYIMKHTSGDKSYPIISCFELTHTQEVEGSLGSFEADMSGKWNFCSDFH